MKRLLAIVVLMLVITCLAFGQQQTAPPPKPGPEVSRLGSMVGTWKTDTGETVTYEWFDGGFSLIGHVENSGPEGKSTELRIITYDPDAKTYSQYRITSTGPGGTLSRGGTVSGNTWVWPLDGTECGNQGNAVSASLRIRQRPLLQSSKFQRVVGRRPSPLRRKA